MHGRDKREIEDRARKGALADFSDRKKKPKIDADLIRRLMLGGPETIGPALRIKGAYIEGAIDLADCIPPHAGHLPALELIDCDIPEPISLRHCRLTRLDLTGSRLTEIDGRRLQTKGDVMLKCVKAYSRSTNTEERAAIYQESADNSKDTCMVKLGGAEIGGSVIAAGAQLRAKGNQPDHNPRSDQSNYALKLAEAQIAGSLICQPNFKAYGGVSVTNARIGGHIWMMGATLTAIDAFAFNGQTAHIDGGIVLRSYEATSIELPCTNENKDPVKTQTFISRGAIHLLGARIGSYLDMCGAQISLPPIKTPAYEFMPSDGFIAINFAGAEISRDVCLRPANGCEIDRDNPESGAHIKGSIKADDAHVGGSFELQGTCLELEYRNAVSKNSHLFDTSVSAPRIRVAGNIDFTNARTRRLNFNGGSVTGDALFDRGETKFDESASSAKNGENAEENAPQAGETNSKKAAVDFGDFHVGKRLSLDGRCIEGQLNLRRANIHGELHLAQYIVSKISYICTENKNNTIDSSIAFNYKHSSIKDSHKCRLAKIFIKYACVEIIEFNDKIKGYFIKTSKRETSLYPGPSYKTIDARKIRVGGNFILNCRWNACADFTGSYFAGTVSLRYLFNKNKIIQFSKLVLDNSLIYQSLQIRDNKSEEKNYVNCRDAKHHSISLQYTSAEVLDDYAGKAWPDNCFHYFDGFNYNYIRLNKDHKTENGFWRKISYIKYAFNYCITPNKFLIFLNRPKGDHDPALHRIWWLSQSAHNDVEQNYRPHAFQQLSKVLKEQGLYDAARRIISYRLTLERKVLPQPNPVLTILVMLIFYSMAVGTTDWTVPESSSGWIGLALAVIGISFFIRYIMFFYWMFFDYGLSVKRGVFWLVASLAVGAAATDYAANAGMLVADPLPVADVVVRDEPAKRQRPSPMTYGMAGADGTSYPSVACGDTINAFVYAADVFIPLVEFRQEFRCHIRAPLPEDRYEPDPKGNVFSRFFDWLRHLPETPDFWFIAKGVYAVLGWLIVSLTILTATGLLRRQAET